MTLTTIQNRTWFLLREPGPLTGYAATASQDFPQAMITQDANLALAEFLSQTGIAPGLIERMDVLPVYPVLDMPVPPGLQALTRIEYTQAGQQPYCVIPLSFEEWDLKFGDSLPYATGNPYYFRTPYAGYVRMLPQPTVANQVGPGTGTITFEGNVAVGQVVTVTLTNPGSAAVTTTYTTLSTDSASSVAANVASLINTGPAVQGVLAFMAPVSANANQIDLTSLNAPGTTITYSVTVTGSGLSGLPTVATQLSPNGDSMTWYYTSTGALLVDPQDTPTLPPQFHMALVYRMLADYWEVKQDGPQADRYMKKFEMCVAKGKAYWFDSNRAVQPTTAGNDDTDYGDFVGY
jgi:hypothetical protein